MNYDVMGWEECTAEFIRKVELDPVKVTSIVSMALRRRAFAQSITATKDTVHFVFDAYYEVVKELLTALLLRHGMRSRNHQCLFTFFDKEYKSERHTTLLKQMNFLRNRLNYYGEEIDLVYFTQNYKRFEELIDFIVGKI